MEENQGLFLMASAETENSWEECFKVAEDVALKAGEVSPSSI